MWIWCRTGSGSGQRGWRSRILSGWGRVNPRGCCSGWCSGCCWGWCWGWTRRCSCFGAAVALLLAVGVLLAVECAGLRGAPAGAAGGLRRGAGGGCSAGRGFGGRGRARAGRRGGGTARSFALGFGDVDAGSETASRMTALARRDRAGRGRGRRRLAADAGRVHRAGARRVERAGLAAVPPPRRPPMMLEETMATPARMPNAEDPDRADLMAAPSSPWSSSSRPRVSFG